MSNPCVRCGKQRINGKTWKGKAGMSVITYTQTVCPDRKCQKMVEDATAQRKAKSALLIENKAKAKLARERAVSVTV